LKVVVCVVDEYVYVSDIFWHFYRKFWPDNPYETVIFAQRNLIRLPTEIVYVGGDARDFGGRLGRFLRQSFDDSILMLLMMDYVLKSPVKTELVKAAEDWCKRPEIGHVRLRPFPHPQRPFRADPKFGEIERGSRYSLSLQPGLWETSVLLGLLRDGEDPWQTEIRGSDRTRYLQKRLLSTLDHAYVHHNYYRKGKVAEGLPKWVKQNW